MSYCLGVLVFVDGVHADCCVTKGSSREQRVLTGGPALSRGTYRVTKGSSRGRGTYRVTKGLAMVLEYVPRNKGV